MARRLPNDHSAPSPAFFGIETARRSTGDDAALYIRRLIFDGVLRPGARVPQDEIAEQLGISRIPIREALIALEREGWVTIELHRGAFINALDEQAVRDHYELFGIVYGFAAQRALARSPLPALLDELGAIAAKAEAATSPAAFSRHALGFHRAVVDAARSPRVKVVLRAMSGLVPGDFFSVVPGAMEAERKELPLIVQAMRKKDGDKVAAEYVKMMRRVGEQVVEVLDGRGLFELAEAIEPGTNDGPAKRSSRRTATATKTRARAPSRRRRSTSS